MALNCKCSGVSVQGEPRCFAPPRKRRSARQPSSLGRARTATAEGLKSRLHLVSRRFSVVIVECSSKPTSALDCSRLGRFIKFWKDDRVIQALMSAFPAVKRFQLSHRAAQRALTKEDHPVHTQFLGCAYPAFSKRIQVRTFPRKSNRLHSGVSQNLPKRFRNTRRAIMDQISVAGGETVEAIGQVAGGLFHPIVVWFGNDTCNSHFSGRQPDHE